MSTFIDICISLGASQDFFVALKSIGEKHVGFAGPSIWRVFAAKTDPELRGKSTCGYLWINMKVMCVKSF